jgi:hypothetical protein
LYNYFAGLGRKFESRGKKDGLASALHGIHVPTLPDTFLPGVRWGEINLLPNLLPFSLSPSYEL